MTVQGMRRTRTQDLAAGVSTDERVVIQWHAETQGIPVRQLLRAHSVAGLLDRALDAVTASAFVVPADVTEAAQRLRGNVIA